MLLCALVHIKGISSVDLFTFYVLAVFEETSFNCGEYRLFMKLKPFNSEATKEACCGFLNLTNVFPFSLKSS